jgi:hypothetical protein
MAPAGEPHGPAPLVSVVVSTFNSRVTLERALASILGQTFRDYEVWVVGDGCTDGSEAVVAACGDPRLRWVGLDGPSGSQAGPNNEGARRARGRYVAYLGHDDLWFPWHLATLVDAATGERAGLAHGLGAVLGPGVTMAAGPPRHGAGYRGHFVPPTNWLVERAALERIGGWRRPEACGRPVDVDVLDRLAAAGTRFACAARLTTIKFPSAMWRSYAADAPRPQIAMAEALARDPDGLRLRLLHDIAAEHARATFPTWAPPSPLIWRAAAAAVRHAAVVTLRGAEAAPGIGALVRWRFRRGWRRARIRRGLD